LIVSNEFGTDTLLKEDYIETRLVGINSPEKILVKVYPNPASTLLKIELQSNSEVTFNLHDMYGRSILEQQYLKNDISIDVTNLKPGIYLLHVNSVNSQETLVKKIFIQ